MWQVFSKAYNLNSSDIVRIHVSINQKIVDDSSQTMYVASDVLFFMN